MGTSTNRKPEMPNYPSSYPFPFRKENNWMDSTAPGGYDYSNTIYGQNSPNGPDSNLAPGQYQTSAATRPLGHSQRWQSDPALQHLGGGVDQMLGYNKETGKYDTSSGSLMGGPGQAFSPAQLSGLYTQGMQSLNASNKAATAGAATNAASRGSAGLSPALLLNSRSASDRGALARGNLDAQLKGLELGLNQYNAKGNVFGNVLQGADAEQARNTQNQQIDATARRQDKQYWQQQAANAEQAINNFYGAGGTQVVQSPGSGGGRSGQDEKARWRNMLADLQNRYQIAVQNRDRYAI